MVARINPVRFHKAKKGDTKPPMPLAQALTRMAAAVKNFKAAVREGEAEAAAEPLPVRIETESGRR